MAFMIDCSCWCWRCPCAPPPHAVFLPGTGSCGPGPAQGLPLLTGDFSPPQLFTLENLTQLNKLVLKWGRRGLNWDWIKGRCPSVPPPPDRQTEEPFPSFILTRSPFPRGCSSVNAELLFEAGMLNAGSFGCDLWQRSDGRA